MLFNCETSSRILKLRKVFKMDNRNILYRVSIVLFQFVIPSAPDAFSMCAPSEDILLWTAKGGQEIMVVKSVQLIGFSVI